MFSILIVDDNLYDREGMREMVDWESLGITVAGMASNGAEGYRKALELKPDMVLTDIAMPVMNGIEMTEKIKERLPETKFLFLSCYDEFDFAKHAIQLGVSAYVLKPIKIPELTDAISRMKLQLIAQQEAFKLEEELRFKVRESIPALGEQLIRDLLHGRISAGMDMVERLQYLGIPVETSCRVILLHIDNYELVFDNIPMEQKYIKIYSIRKCAKELLLTPYAGFLLVQDYGNLCAVLFEKNTNRQESLDQVLEACSILKDTVNHTLELPVTIGISDPGMSIWEIPQLFTQAQSVIESMFTGEGNRIILASEVGQAQESFNFNFGHLVQDVEQVLASGEQNDIENLLHKYCSTDTGHHKTYMKSLSLSMLNALQIALGERNENLGSIFGDEKKVWDKVLRFETILDIHQWLKQVFAATGEYLENSQPKRHSHLIQSFKTIIEKEYATIENVSQITDRLFISPSYANFIFKKETGKTIFEYLVLTRMEKAKGLLEDVNCRVYEVAEQVGYTSKPYFSNVFRQYTGITPKQYREQCCKAYPL